MTITVFLAARLDEDEAVARDLVRTLAESIAFSMYPDQTVMDDPELIEAFEGAAEKALTDFGMTPARVLADVAAKRAIVAMYVQRSEQADQHLAIAAHVTGLGLAVKALAAVWSAHPDWREEWRP